MKRTLAVLVFAVLVFVVSGSGVSQESDRLAKARTAVGQLSRAVVDVDVNAFKRVAWSERLPADASREDVDAQLKQALIMQRDGWVRNFGTESPPKIAEIVDGYEGEFTVFLEVDGVKDDKPLYFIEESSGVYFAGLSLPS